MLKQQEEAPNRMKVDGKAISCDQVAWLLDIFERYMPRKIQLGVSRHDEMLRYGMLYEVMDIAGLVFEDERARWNGTPHDARDNSEMNVPEITNKQG